MGSVQPLHYCRYFELKKNIPRYSAGHWGRRLHNQLCFVGHAMLAFITACQLCQTWPSLRASGRWRYYSSFKCHCYRCGWFGAAPDKVLRCSSLTNCSAKRKKGQGCGSYWPCPPHEALWLPQCAGRGWRLLGGDGAQGAQLPAHGRFAADVMRRVGQSCPAKLSEPSGLPSYTPHSSLPWLLLPFHRFCHLLSSPAVLTQTCCW